MEQNELKLHIQLTEKDYLKFQWAHSGVKRSKGWMVYGLLVLVVPGFVVIHSILQNGFSSIAEPAFLPLLIIPVLYLLTRAFIIYRTRMAFKNDSFINQPYDITINPEGLVVNGYRSSFSPLWKDIYKYTVTKEAVYIYVSDLKALIIPERYLAHETDSATLFGLLKTNVNTENYSKQKKKNTSIRIIYYAIIFAVVLFIVFKDFGKESRFNEARQLQENEDFAGAKLIYSELIAKDAGDINSYLERAKCEVSLSEFKLAIADCETALRLDPNSGITYYYYAYALYNDQRYDEACKAITRSMNLGYTRNTNGLCE